MREDIEKKYEAAKALTAKLTLDEKIDMVHGAQLFQTAGVERLSIPPLKMSDGPMGVRQEFLPTSWQTRGFTDDYVTYLPCNSALATTFNRRLAYDTGSVLGPEARGRGKDVILAPGINMKRSPLCGRNFEYFSEDPFLTKELAVPFIQGVQNWDVAACVKHFAVNNQETERLWVEVLIDEEALRNIYLPAFYSAVTQGDCYTIMGAYNLVKGEHCCQSSYLLKDILREEWEYQGVVISDWGAVHDTDKAANSQLDIEMSVTDNFDEYFMAEPLTEKIKKGEIKEEVLDEKVTRIIMLMMRLHMLEGQERKSGTYNTVKHRKMALDVARESIVLLKNENNILPLSKKEMKRILVIGENADHTHANGGGSAEIKALYEITPLLGLTMLLGGNTEVCFVRGYCSEEREDTSDTNWQEKSLLNGGGITCSLDSDQNKKDERIALREEALKLAAEYDRVIYIGGLNHQIDSEGKDRESMKLPYEQDILITELLKIQPEAVIALVGGSPVEMGEWIKKAKTVLFSYYAGCEGGTALAEVLLGEINPSGKLPETFYKNHMDCSAHALGEFPGGKTVRYAEGVFVGYRYNGTFGVKPEFCFGHGLTYTSFSCSEAVICREDDNTGKTGTVKIKCKVTNTGKYEGKEVLQVYLASKEPSKGKPERELKGFEKIELAAGESKEVIVEVEDWQEDMKVFLGKSYEEVEEVRA